MSCKPIARIQPPLLVQRLKLRQLVAVRLNKSLLVWRNVLFQRDGLVLGRGLKTANRGLNLLHRNVQPLRDQWQIGIQILDLLPQQITRDRRIVVDQQTAFAVK